MPGSVAETVHGRRGGGWLPKPARSSPERPRGDRACTVCGLALSAHSGEVCPPCGRPLEHHGPGEVDECWAGRARMAAALVAAASDVVWVDSLGRERLLVPALDAVDLEALERAAL